MFERTGKDASGRLGTGSRALSKSGCGLRVESLEGRALLTASLAPLPSVTVEATAGYQVPLNGTATGNTDPQTFSVTTDNAAGGVVATVAKGNFLTVNVSHASGGANDPAFSGSMVFQDFSDLTPVAVSKIESLATGTATGLAPGVTIGSDYYAGKNFHRIANQFPDANSYIVQGGSLTGDGRGNVFATGFGVEKSPQLVFNGIGQLALANTGAANSNDSQFFVTTGSPRFLDGNYTIFGQILSGQDILAKMTQAPRNGQAPIGAITINSVTVSSTNPDGVLHIDATKATAGRQTNVTVTATDAVNGSKTSQTFPVLAVASQAGSEPTSTQPRLNTVTTPQSFSLGQSNQFQLSANNPAGGRLTYTVQGGLAANAFTPAQNATATVDANGLVTVTPTPGYIGPINLVVGVRDQTNRAGSSAALDSPANFSTQAVTLNVVQPASTGTVRFLLDGNAANPAAGSLVVTPLPRTDGGTNTIVVTQAAGNVMVTVNGALDALEPAVSNVDRIIVYGSKASDNISIDPGLSMGASLDGGRGGTNVLKAGGGPTREQGWYGKNNTLVQGSSNNYQFGRQGHVTFVKGSGTSDVIFAGVPGHTVGHSRRIRTFPTPPHGTFYTFNGTKLVKTADRFTTHKTTVTATRAATTTTATAAAVKPATNQTAKK